MECKCTLIILFCTDQKLLKTRQDFTLSTGEKNLYSSKIAEFLFYSPSEGYVDGSELKEIFSLEEHW